VSAWYLHFAGDDRIGQIETEYEVERPRSARRRVCGSRYLEVEMFLAAEQEDGRVWG
jgi:hypothetical protein